MQRQNGTLILLPVQQKALEMLLEATQTDTIALLRGRPRSGKTTILKRLQTESGGVLLGLRDSANVVDSDAPSFIEEGFLRMMQDALSSYDLVIIDDLQVITTVTHNSDPERAYLLDAALTAMIGEAVFLKKTMVFATEGDAPWPILRRAFTCEIGDSG